MRTDKVIEQEHQYILQTYGRPDFVLERGNGVYLFDLDGRVYQFSPHHDRTARC